MYISRSGSLAKVAVVVFVIAQSLGAARESVAASPDLESEAALDTSHVERIVPGSTAREEIFDWFGEPDTGLEFEDGTSRWVYRETRAALGDAVRARRVAHTKTAERAANAKRFAESTKTLAKAGRNQVRNLFDWLDRTFRYPPRPIRRPRQYDPEPPAAVSSAPVDTTADDGEEAARAVDQSEFFLEEDVVGESEEGPILSRMKLVIRFARDGVVDRFEYRRAAVRSSEE